MGSINILISKTYFGCDDTEICILRSTELYSFAFTSENCRWKISISFRSTLNFVWNERNLSLILHTTLFIYLSSHINLALNLKCFFLIKRKENYHLNEWMNEEENKMIKCMIFSPFSTGKSVQQQCDSREFLCTTSYLATHMSHFTTQMYVTRIFSKNLDNAIRHIINFNVKILHFCFIQQRLNVGCNKQPKTYYIYTHLLSVLIVHINFPFKENQKKKH